MPRAGPRPSAPPRASANGSARTIQVSTRMSIDISASTKRVTGVMGGALRLSGILPSGSALADQERFGGQDTILPESRQAAGHRGPPACHRTHGRSTILFTEAVVEADDGMTRGTRLVLGAPETPTRRV